MPSTENNYVATDLGNIALNPCGEYSKSTLYEYLDMVSYQGGSYFCKVDFPQKISGIAPEPGKNTEHWQMLTLPGGLTSDYIAMHDDVVNKTKQVETSRAAVELSQQEVEAAQADVSQMRQDTQEASEEAAASRDSAAGYAQSAETSRTAAKESEDNINAQVTGFDTHVEEKTSVAEAAVEEARKTAINAVTAQEDTSTKAVSDEGTKQVKAVADEGTTQTGRVAGAGNAAVNAVATQQSKIVQAVTDEGTKQIETINTTTEEQITAINTAGSSQIASVEKAGTSQVTAVNTAGTTQKKAVEDTGNEQEVKLTKAAAEELIKLQKVVKEFEGDHAHVENLETRVSVVEKQIANINMDEDRLDNILLDVESGLAATKYPVGTQIVTDWNKIDSSGNKTAYRPELNIVHYSNTVIKDTEETEERNANVMYLEWDKTIPDGFAFCTQQALQCFDGTEGAPDGLPAGNYSIKMVAKNGGSAFKTKWDGKYANFTLTKDIPSGGIIRLTVSDWNGTSETAIAMHVITNAGINESDAKIEEVIVTESADSIADGYTLLGETWGEDVGYGKLNYPECCYYGDNAWATSDLRQWLNGEGADWWTKQTRYNRKPSVATRIQGYLTGLDEGLKSHIKFAKNTTIGNNLKYLDQEFVTYDRVFLHSFNQSNITTGYSSQSDNEGEVWEYYKKLAEGADNLNAQKMFKIWNTYPILIRYAINATTTAQYVFTRSAALGTACTVHGVSPSGGCGNAGASYGHRCLPACLIAK